MKREERRETIVGIKIELFLIRRRGKRLFPRFSPTFHTSHERLLGTPDLGRVLRATGSALEQAYPTLFAEMAKLFVKGAEAKLEPKLDD